MKRSISILLLVFLTSCSWTSKEKITSSIENASWGTTSTQAVSTGTTSLDTASWMSDHQEPLEKTYSWSQDEYTLSFNENNEANVTVHHTTGKPTKVYFINSEAKSMNLVVFLTHPRKDNLRLSQIVMPDGTMDGPFWQEVNYELTQKGGYQLIFTENNMAGDPWSGDAMIAVSLKK